jgi:hypothetical protein
MNSAKPEWADSEWRRLLAAYADDELDAYQRARVDAYLANHPDAVRDFNAQRDLSPRNVEFWAAVEPPAPSSRAWDRVWSGVQGGESRRPPQRPIWPNRWMRRGLMALAMAITPAAAAAVVLAVSLDRPAAPEQGVQLPDSESTEETLIVARTSDVEIRSIRDADAPLLVVGDPPWTQPISLATSGDVRLDGVRPDGDGMMPAAHMGDAAGVPMIFPPVARNP